MESIHRKSSALADALSAVLPSDLSISIYHIATPPTKTAPLFTPPPSKKPAPTTLESHFVVISHNDVLVFAIELLVYTILPSAERIIFISKADSSGYLPTSVASFTSTSAPGLRVSILRSIATAVVTTVLEGVRVAAPNCKITVSLFARSQTQYLFPNSGSNSAKHVLTDRGLITWWCKVLDPIVQKYSSAGSKAYLLVPGYDKSQTRRLFSSSKQSAGVAWVIGHPFALDPFNDVAVREIIPHFPDDPKSRFLYDLNSDESSKNGARRGKQWNNIRTVDDFWELMSFRQECSLGRSVGFIWLVFDRHVETETVAAKNHGSPPDAESDLESGSMRSRSFAPEISTTQTNCATDLEPVGVGDVEVDMPSLTPNSPSKRRPEENTLLSPRKKKLKTLDIDTYIAKKPLVPAMLVLDDRRYQRTIDSLLLYTDFGNTELAIAGSRQWVQRSYAAGQDSDVVLRHGWNWGERVTGSLKRGGTQEQKQSASSATEIEAVNVLHVRKKAKTTESAVCPVNVLGPGLVKKHQRN